MVSLRKSFIIFIISLFFLFFTATCQSESIMNATVKLAPNILIDVYTDKSSYCPPEIVNITTRLENRGNIGVLGNLSTEVLDPYGVYFLGNSWENVTLGPGYVNYFNITYQVTENDTAGIYTVKSNFSYDQDYKYAEANFRIKQGIGTLVASPPSIEETVMPGDTIVKKLYFWLLYPCYGTNVYLNTSTGPPGDWVIFSSNPIWLSPETWNVTTVYIYIDLPWNTTPGDYEGSIHAYADGQHLVIPLIIHVQPTPIFDVITEVLPEYKDVCNGDDVKARVTITKVFPAETLDVNMTYRIEMDGVTYDERKETIAVTTSVERYVTLRVPSDAEEGFYLFSSTLDYQNNQSVFIYSYDQFYVRYCPPTPTPVYPPSRPRRPAVEVIKPKPKLELKLSKYRLYSIVGEKKSFIAYVTNFGEDLTRSVRLDIRGVPIQWITITPHRSNIPLNETEEFVVAINIPKDAEEKIYYLKIKAKNEHESEEKTLALIVAKDLASLAKVAYEEMEKVRRIASETVLMDCLDITDIVESFNEAEKIREKIALEFEQKNYKEVINLCDYLTSLYEEIITKANVKMDLAFEESRFIMPPFVAEFYKEYVNLGKFVEKRNYKDFCEPYVRIQKLSLYSTLLLIAAVLIVSISLILSLIHI